MTDALGAVAYPPLALYIDGQWRQPTTAAINPLQVCNPAKGLPIATLPMAGADDLAAALAAAQRGFQIWQATPATLRYELITKATRLLRERADDIAAVMTLEQGKPRAEAKREVVLAAEFIDLLAQEGLRLYGRTVAPRAANIVLQQVERVPVGPVAALCAWNFPIDLPARKVGAALAAGCSVVLKPAEQTPGTAVALVQAFADAGLPAGVLNLVTGDPAYISSTLLASDVIRKVSFTGSVAVGKLLGEQAARTVKRYTAELGGHAPVIVCADACEGASLDTLVKACVLGKFRNAGQVCTAPTRFLIDNRVFDAFAERFVAMTRQLVVGDGAIAATQVGPLAHPGRLRAIQLLVDDACEHGAQLLCGGQAVPGEGWFYAPTVLARVPLSARVLNEEPFGPIAILQPFGALDDAIAEANRLPFGLAAYAFARDLATVHRLGEQIQAGMVGINHFSISQPDLPFGGVKHSGLGSEKTQEGLLAYTDVKLVSIGTPV